MTLETPKESLPSPLRCLTGSAIAGVMAYMMYWMANKIAISFASKPITGKTDAAVNIAVAVRTLLVGMTSLGTAVFTIVSVGLILLAIKVAFNPTSSSPSP
jgi:choline-glycine betaine transporter